MTMTRTKKASHATQMRNAAAHGITSVRFSMPRLVQAAKADRGHDYMTGPEYRTHRMGRGDFRSRPASLIREDLACQRISRRSRTRVA